MLINLKKANFIILNEKFQFCIADFKIIDFVYDSNNKFFEISKIIKILK